MNNPYQPPRAPVGEGETEYLVPIDDAAARVSFMLAPGWWSSPRLFLDGQPARPSNGGGFELPMRDGSKAKLRLVFSLTRRIPRVSVNGRKYGKGGAWDGWGYAILILVPFVFFLRQGMFGVPFGAFTLVINRQIALNPGPWWLKALVMLAVIFLSTVTYFFARGLVHP
ncbi:hypothetical protein LVJ94_51765 [Pendulispora rubella]|uniref:Uncharacterized protein n=1 Tax=Pendulispora rubella TaxID=2741070 RepID=A0ABZ2L348_9BACT